MRSRFKIIFVILLILALISFLGWAGFVSMTNYQQTQQFKLAEHLAQSHSSQDWQTAVKIYLELLAHDENHEIIYRRIAEIAEKQHQHPEAVYYRHRALRLNPVNREYVIFYIRALKNARQFHQLENFLKDLPAPRPEEKELLYYVGFHNGNERLYAAKMARPTKSPPDVLRQLNHVFYHHLTPEKATPILQKLCTVPDQFVAYEARLQLTQIQVQQKKLHQAELNFKKCAELNFFATAPSLAKFYATFYSFERAIPVYQKYLKVYKDPVRAIQLAEIYALLNRREAIRKLLFEYQREPGKVAMLSCYYFDALLNLLADDPVKLERNLKPLRGVFNFPLAKYMALYCDIAHDDFSGVINSFEEFQNCRPFMDLPQRGWQLTLQYVRKRLSRGDISPELLGLIQSLENFHSDSFTAQLLLLHKLHHNELSRSELLRFWRQYPHDPVIGRIALEYYTQQDPPFAAKLLDYYKKRFPQEKDTWVKYEIIAAGRDKKWDKVSELFRQSLTPQNIRSYWEFAISQQRLADLKFLSKYKPGGVYQTFAQAAVYLLTAQQNKGLFLLATAPTEGEENLLFFAARQLGLAGWHQEALRRYGEFAPRTPYRLSVLLNTAEIQAAMGELTTACQTAKTAWQSAPRNPSAQLCYADKLLKCGSGLKIPQIIHLPSDPKSFDPQLKKLWQTGMKLAMAQSCARQDWLILRQQCQTLKLYDPHNPAVAEFLQKIPPEKTR